LHALLTSQPYRGRADTAAINTSSITQLPMDATAGQWHTLVPCAGEPPLRSVYLCSQKMMCNCQRLNLPRELGGGTTCHLATNIVQATVLHSTLVLLACCLLFCGCTLHQSQWVQHQTRQSPLNHRLTPQIAVAQADSCGTGPAPSHWAQWHKRLQRQVANAVSQ
jgi:hypothetical protein